MAATTAFMGAAMFNSDFRRLEIKGGKLFKDGFFSKSASQRRKPSLGGKLSSLIEEATTLPRYNQTEVKEVEGN